MKRVLHSRGQIKEKLKKMYQLGNVTHDLVFCVACFGYTVFSYLGRMSRKHKTRHTPFKIPELKKNLNKCFSQSSQNMFLLTLDNLIVNITIHIQSQQFTTINFYSLVEISKCVV